MVDLLVSGGTIVDGSGGTPYPGDIVVDGGLISTVDPPSAGTDDPRAGTVIDATGRLVFPGLIDAHVHGDAVLAEPGAQLASLRQGVTTWILGQDGVSFAPGSAVTVDYAGRYFGAINGAAPAAIAGGTTVGELLTAYDRTSALNAGYLIPAGTVRAEAMGVADRAPSAAETARMLQLVEGGLADGALGLSTGLDYVPGRFADAAEIAALCRPVAAAGRPYVSHIRYYEDRTAEGMAEVAEIVRVSGVSPHVSHYHGPGATLTGIVDAIRADGVEATYDSYPYTRGCSILAMVLLPAWIQADGVDATVERLGDPAALTRLRNEWFPTVVDVVPRVRLAYLDSPAWSWAEGLPLAVAAERAGIAAGDFVCTVLRATRLVASAVFRQPRSGDDDVRMLLRNDAHVGGSDGIPLGGHPHPRFWGAFARFLGHHTRELGDWTWAQAAQHLASRPARRFGLAGRGFLRAGYVADLAVIDPDRVTDRATYDHPTRLAEGVDDVVVGGVPVLRGAELTGATPGRSLRFRTAS